MKNLKLLSLVVLIFITTLSCKKNNNDNYLHFFNVRDYDLQFLYIG